MGDGTEWLCIFPSGDHEGGWQEPRDHEGIGKNIEQRFANKEVGPVGRGEKGKDWHMD